MKPAVNGVEEKFVMDGDFELDTFLFGYFWADDDFSVLESDDIGGTLVLKKGLVEDGYFFWCDEDVIDLVVRKRFEFCKLVKLLGYFDEWQSMFLLTIDQVYFLVLHL